MNKGNAKIVVRQQKPIEAKDDIVTKEDSILTEEIVPQTSESFNQFKYIKHIYECERDLQILKVRSKKIPGEIAKLDPVPYENTQMSRDCYHERKSHDFAGKIPEKGNYHTKKAFERIRVLAYIAGAGGGIVCAIFGIVKIVLFSFFENILGDLLITIGLYAGIMAVAGIIMLSLLIYGKTTDQHIYDDSMKKYLQKEEKAEANNIIIDEHNRHVEEKYKQKYNSYYQRMNEKKSIIYPMLSSEQDAIKQRINELNDTLQMLYNLKIDGVYCLHPNYRGLSTISILYGYFETGRCTQLQGHEGAYNLYEDEKLKGIIISKVNEISYKLDKLNATMSYVGMVMNEINNQVAILADESTRISNEISNIQNQIAKTGDRINSNISSQLNSIRENTANSAYYSEIGARAATFNATYNYLK